MKQKSGNRCKNITLVFSIFIVMLFYFGISNSDANSDVVESGVQEFTIKKVDENGEPLKDVQFSITGDSKIEFKGYYSNEYDPDDYTAKDLEEEKKAEGKKLYEEWKKRLTLEFEDNEYKLKNPIELKYHDKTVSDQGYVKYDVDLTDEIYDCTLNINGEFKTENTDLKKVYVEIDINEDEEKIYANATSNNVNFEKKLIAGNKYTVNVYLFYGGNKWENNIGNSTLTINEISLKFDGNIYTTNENGEIKHSYREGSKLKIEEIKPLEGYYKSKGYQMDDRYYTFDRKFSISKSHENEITVVNKKYRDLIINKVDDAGNSVSDVTFNIDGIMGDPKFDLGNYYYNTDSTISRSNYENVIKLDKPIVLRAEYEKDNEHENEKENEKEYNVFNYFCEYDIDLTNEKMDYILTIDGILNEEKENCNSYATIQINNKDMQKIDKNSSDVNFKTTLTSGSKYKLVIYFHADNCDECFKYKKDKDTEEILDGSYKGNTVTINSIMLKPNNIYKTDKDGKIKIPVINGDIVQLKEIETPYGYKKTEGYFVGDEYHTFDETFVVNTKEDKIDIKVVNDRIKRKVVVNHYLKGTDKKVAESEEREYPILDEYTTNGHSDLPGLTFEKNEAGEDVFPSNANGVVEDKDYDTPIVVDYYYEPQDIEITIHHYKEGTNEKLAEDEVLNYPVNLVPDENGIYRAENPTVKYVLESNENYQDLIKKYNLTDITSTIDPDLTIKDYLESGKSFEITYYYNDLKEEDKIENNKSSDNENVNENNDNNIITNIIEGIKTGDNIFIYILGLLIALGVILKIKRNKNSGKHKK